MRKPKEDRNDRDRRRESQTARDAPTGSEEEGRREDVRGSGVYPASSGDAPDDAVVRTPGEWGKGAGGEEGGSSELRFSDEEQRAAERGEIPASELGDEEERQQ